MGLRRLGQRPSSAQLLQELGWRDPKQLGRRVQRAVDGDARLPMVAPRPRPEPVAEGDLPLGDALLQPLGLLLREPAGLGRLVRQLARRLL
ncbi:MAG: hypothetical protein HYY05_02985, partial [Chloroflexi bacterium]|nr:hypothetical protein [Chloroflexota bacterium]